MSLAARVLPYTASESDVIAPKDRMCSTIFIESISLREQSGGAIDLCQWI